MRHNESEKCYGEGRLAFKLRMKDQGRLTCTVATIVLVTEQNMTEASPSDVPFITWERKDQW